MAMNTTLLVVGAGLLLCACGHGQPPAPAERASGYWPPEQEVAAALETFDEYAKERAFEGLGTSEAVEKARADRKAGDPPPDAEWVNYWMAKSDEFIYDMISPENPRSLVPNYNQGCPLHLGKSTSILPVWGKPNTYRCKFGGEEWAPGMKVKNPATGEMVEIVDDGKGWQPPEGFPQHQMFYFKPAYRMFLLRMLVSHPYGEPVDFDGPALKEHGPPVRALAWAYAVTGEQKYADKALIILNKLAECYRWYNSRVDTKVDWRVSASRGYIGDHVFENGHIKTLAASYDLVFDAVADAGGVVDFFGNKQGADYNGDGDADTEDISYNIEHNLFGYCWEFLRRSARRGTSNGRMANLEAMAHLGLVFRNDKMIEELIDGPAGIRHGVIGAFYREGRGHEDSSSYSWGVNKLYLGIGRALSQYQGREIYTDGLDVYTEFGSRYGMIERWRETSSCDGGFFGYGDGGGTRALVVPRGELSETFLGHEVGMTLMHMGSDYRTRLHALLYHANSGVGHGHRDQLMLKIMAYGYDFAADLGYPMNLGSLKRREWTDSTITHPTVLIDETAQQRGSCASEDAFGACEWAQVASAYSYDTYAQAHLYHRTAAVIQVDDDHHFVIDVFRVKGGSQHDYPFHSDSGEEGTNFAITCGEQLVQRAGTLAGEDVEYLSRTKNGYSYVKDIRRGDVDGTFTATWRRGDEAGTGYSIHMLGAAGREVILGKGEARGIVHRSPLDAYLVVRSSGQEELSTIFIAVHEPFQGEDMGLTIEALPMPDFDEREMPAGLKITTADGREYRLQSVIAALQEGERYEGPQSVLIEGPEGELAVNWPPGADGEPTRGEIVEVDYGNNRMKVTTEAELTDAPGRILHIQNPMYPKAVAFDIKMVERIAGDEWWITTVLEPIVATNAITEVDTDAGCLVSPYNMAKHRECRRFFDGKVIVCQQEPGEVMRIASAALVMEGLPTHVVTLADPKQAANFTPDKSYAIYDYGPGDTWYICDVEVR